MEDSVTLSELLDLSIGTPQQGAVNFSALHALLHAVLRQLGIREVKIRWREPPRGDDPRGDDPPDAPLGVAGPAQGEHLETSGRREQKARHGVELPERGTPSPTPDPAPAPAADGQSKLRCRIQTCEDDVSEALRLIQELHSQRDGLRDEIEELRRQQQMFGAEAESLAAVATCCHRVDELQEAVRSLKDASQPPDPEQPGPCVTWDVLQAALLSGGGDAQELMNIDPAASVRTTHTPFNSNLPAAPDPSAPSSPHPAEEADGTEAAPPQAAATSSERYSETVQALTNIGKLGGKFNKLEARVAALEDRKVDRTQLAPLREAITSRGSQDVSNNVVDQLNQQRELIDSLMSDREKLDGLEEMFMSLINQDRDATSEAASGSEDSDGKATHELRQQINYLRRSVQKLEEGVKQLKAKQVLSERTADSHLQDQLDDLRGMLEDMMMSLTSQLSSSLQDEGQDESDSEGLGQSKERSAFTCSAVNIGRRLSRLFQQYEQLQDTVNGLLQLQPAGRAGAPRDREAGQNVELVNDVQKEILQLQAECEKLHEKTSCLYEDNRQKQSHIEELYKTTEELEEKKADKQMVESGIKADKSALDSKVSRLQFDSATEQLNSMFHELLNKVTGQEQDWHKVITRLSTEMECKLNRIELDSVKKQLEDRWKNIYAKLQVQGAPEHEDAAGIRKQLVDRFHCLSCDRPVVKHTPGPHLVTLPCTPGFPSHKSIRPFTVYALEQFRQHYRSLKPGTNRYNFEVANSGRRRGQLQKSHAMMCRQLESAQRRLRRCDRAGGQHATSDGPNQSQPGVHERIAELTDCSHLAVSRSCGGSHTVTSAGQRRTGLQYVKHHGQPEADGGVQSEEVDIVGLDGHIYRGRLNPAANRNTETKLPTISTKDGLCKIKDKAKCSPSHKPAASPELGLGAPVHLPPGAKAAQCSRSASSSSGRDWPVSALGCTSQSSVTQASAAADRTSEPQDEQQAEL